MDKVINMNELIGAAAGDQQHMLGKFLYFSLANLLVDKDELSHLCESLGIPYSGSNRLSVSDAFRSPQVISESASLLRRIVRRTSTLPTAGIISTPLVFSPAN